MSITDELVGSAIDVAQDKLHGKEKEEKTTFGGMLLRFLISTIWVVFTLLVSVVAFLGVVSGSFMAEFLGDENGHVICLLAIGLCLAIFLITFIVPYLRKKGSMTRWCGIVALGDALWWIYLMVTGIYTN